MLTPSQALDIVLNEAKKLTDTKPSEYVALDESLNRVLDEDIKADRPSPPFNRASMDGIGVKKTYLQNALNSKAKSISFDIVGFVPAGVEGCNIQNENECIEIMTGAKTPNSVDMIIPYELVQIDSNTKKANVDLLNFTQTQDNIHKCGNDFKQNDILIKQNTIIKPTHIALLSSIGKGGEDKIKVKNQLSIGIISSGDELVGLDDNPTDFQIRASHIPTLSAIAKSNHINITKGVVVQDDEKVLSKCIKNYINTYDIVLLTGGVSMGKRDFIPSLLEQCGVENIFHKIAQRPGKPLWFGKSSATNKIVFGLPGNPISAAMCFKKYVVPFVYAQMNMQIKPKTIISEDSFDGLSFNFFRMCLLSDEFKAKKISLSGSADLFALGMSDGFISIPAGGSIKKGDQVEFYSWKM